MKNKNNKNTSNLIFSACLVTAFVVCSYFFSGMITSSTGMNETVKAILTALIFVVFGLFLFYATRVGDGKQIKRFSLSTLIIMDLPALYIILASVASGLPFSEQISSCAPLVYLASVVLGYGIPYTFLSGYEIQPEENSTSDSSEEELDDVDDEPDEVIDEAIDEDKEVDTVNEEKVDSNNQNEEE